MFKNEKKKKKEPYKIEIMYLSGAKFRPATVH